VILHKFWSAFVAQINKIANVFWEADPIAQMRYEYDRAVEQLKEGRVGLEQYRGLVERVTRQVSANKSHVQKLEAETKAYLKAGDRTTAAKFALELQKAKEELATNEGQLQMHETAYGNSLKKIQHANEKLIELRGKIQKYDAELKMSAAEAEIAKLSETFDMNLTTDFGEIRNRDPAEDRSESREGARRRGSFAQGDRRDPGRRAHAESARRGCAHQFRDRARVEISRDVADGADGERSRTRSDREGHGKTDELTGVFDSWPTDSPDLRFTSRSFSWWSAWSASRCGATERLGRSRSPVNSRPTN
jgi:phage shock protein A